MAMYVLTDHREERSQARARQFRLLSAVIVMTAVSVISPLGNALAQTYHTVTVGLEQALHH